MNDYSDYDKGIQQIQANREIDSMQNICYIIYMFIDILNKMPLLRYMHTDTSFKDKPVELAGVE